METNFDKPLDKQVNANTQAIAELDKDSFDLAGDTVYTGDVFSAGHGVKRCSSSATNLPVSANGTLISIIRASDIRFLEFITDSGRTFTNTLNGVNWTGWQELACISSVTFTATSVSSTVDISSNVPSGKTIVSAYSSAGNLCCIPYLDNNGKWFLFLRGSASWQTVADASRSFTVAYK